MKKLMGFCALATLLASCGDNSGGGIFYTAPSGSVSSTQAAALTTTMTNAVTTQLTGTPAEAPSLGTIRGGGRDPLSRFSNKLDSCTTTVGGVTPDADSDGIPAHLKRTYACTNVVVPGDRATSQYTVNGTMEITDKDDTVDTGKGGGYRYDYNATAGFVLTDGSNAGFKEAWTYKGFFEMTKTTTRATTTSYKSNWQGSSSGGGGGHADFSSTYGSNWSYEFTPASATTGSTSLSGYYGYTGTGDTRTPATTVVFEVKSADLTYDTACAKYWKTGSIEFSDGSKNIVKFTFACSKYSCAYNGSPVAGVGCDNS